MAKWIDLGHTSAKLKMASLKVPDQEKEVLHLFITGLPSASPQWAASIRELGFNAAPSNKYLVRRVAPGEKLAPSAFRAVFPSARLVEMEPDKYMLRQRSVVPRADEDGTNQAEVDLKSMRYLGRNEDGDQVYESPTDRFVLSVLADGRTKRVLEDAAKSDNGRFLRAAQKSSSVLDLSDEALADALIACARGFVRSMDMGEVQHSEDFQRFRSAVFPGGIEPPDASERLREAIDAALLNYVAQGYEVAVDSFGPMARLYDYLPPYEGSTRGSGALPQPLAVALQRLMGDTAGKRVLIPNAWDRALHAFLPQDTKVLAFRAANVQGRILPEIAKLDVFSSLEEPADGMIFNGDPARDDQGARLDFQEAIRALKHLAPGSRAVLSFSATDAGSSGAISQEFARFLTVLGSRYSIEDCFDTAPILAQKAGGVGALRVISVLAAEPDDVSSEKLRALIETGSKVIASWDDIKSHVSEFIDRLDVREAQAKAVSLERAADQFSYQKPYLAFSKVGEARTMVPANLQSAVQSYMTRMESVWGPVDEFVGKELNLSFDSLKARFSPEQVDGIAMCLSRFKLNYSSILSDDTGIGKGRQLAALAAWAVINKMNVVFCTEKSNLFSDLARDLKHIGEWDRFRPLVMNSDGQITYEPAAGVKPEVLAEGTSPAMMASIIENGTTLEELQSNIIFTTYSQINGEESDKARWLKEQAPNALVIFDEAHTGAGSDSNISKNIVEISSLAKQVQFASATWAKTPENLHIYKRALPEGVSLANLSDTMRRGGETFAEIFSTMLAADGALIRREHDLSKLEVEIRIDQDNAARNERVSDSVAEVLGAATFMSGEMNQVFIRANANTYRVLKAARDARSSGQKAKLFSASFGAGSVIYQAMKSVQGALNAENVVQLCAQSLKDGMKPVIVSDATGEALMNSFLAEYEKKFREDNNIEPGQELTLEQVPMPGLRDMLRHIIFNRLAYVKVAEVQPDQIDQISGAASDGDEPSEAEVDGDDGAAEQSEAAATPAQAQPGQRGEEYEESSDEVSLVAALEEANGRASLVQELRQEADLVRRLPYICLKATTLARNDVGAHLILDMGGAKKKSFRIARGIMMPGKLYELTNNEAYQGWNIVEAATGDIREGSITVTDPEGVAHTIRADPEGFAAFGELSPKLKKKKAAPIRYVEYRISDLDTFLPEAKAIYERGLKEIEERIAQVENIPVLSFDVMAQALRERGFRVGEISGRSHSYRRAASSGAQSQEQPMWERVIRNKSKQAVKATIRAFNNGDIDVAIINRSAASGVSMHASPKFADTRRRHLLEHQIPEDPVARIQLLGRVNRYDQVSFPLITTASTGNYGEVRYLMQQNRKLASMSANTRSSRDNAMSIKGVVDLFNSVGDQAVRGFLADNPMITRRLGIEVDRIDVPGIVNAVTMRIPLLKVSEQRRVYEELYSRFDEIVLRAELEGENPLRPNEMDIRAATSAEQIFFGEEVGDGKVVSAFDTPVYAKKIEWTQTRNPMTLDQAGKIVKENTERLLTSGYLVKNGEHYEVSESQQQRVIEGFWSLARLAAMSTNHIQVEDAAVEVVTVRRAVLRHEWMKKFFKQLVPGARIAKIAHDDNALPYGDLSETSIITDVRPPENENDWLDLGKWRLSIVTSGDEREAQYTLRSMLSRVDGSVSKGEIASSLLISLWGPQLRQSIFAHAGTMRDAATTIAANHFEYAERGKITRRATILDGNMYLAADWAAATRKGQSVVYTDRDGKRHRAVLLPKDMENIQPGYFPVRLNDQLAIEGMLLRMTEPLVADMTFKSALGAVQSTSLNAIKQHRNDMVIYVPQSGIYILQQHKDLARVARLLRQSLRSGSEAGLEIAVSNKINSRLPEVVQQSMRIEGTRTRQDLFANTQTGAVTSKLGALFVSARTPQQLRQALTLLREEIGFDLYVTGNEEMAMARECLAQVRDERRGRVDSLLRSAGVVHEDPTQPQDHRDGEGNDVVHEQCAPA